MGVLRERPGAEPGRQWCAQREVVRGEPGMPSWVIGT